MSGFSLNAEGLSLIDGGGGGTGPTTNPVTPAQGGTGIVNNNASTLTISGAFATTLTVTNTTGVTLPTAGTLATLAGSEALTNKTLNGLTVTSSTGTLTILNGSTLATAGAFATTLTATNTTNVTLPTTGTLATLAGSEALTNKTLNGLTVTSSTGTLTILNGSTLATAGAFATTLTATNTTNVTLPTTGTLATLAGAETFTNKILSASRFASGTWASAPGSPTAGDLYFATDAGAGGSMLRWTGTRWKPLGVVLLAALDTPSGNIANSETNVFQYSIPAGLWQVGDRLRLTYTLAKSGTTDTGTARYRIGTAGTAGSDTQINTSSELVMAAANLANGMIIDIRLESATTCQQLGANNANSANSGYSQLGSSAFVTAKTITNSSSNALFFTLSLLSGGGSNTLICKDAQLEWRATPN